MVGPTKEEVWKNLGYDKTFNTTEEYFKYIFDNFQYSDKMLFYKKWKDEDGMVVIDYNQLTKNMDCYLSKYTEIMGKIFTLTSTEVTNIIKQFLKEKLRLSNNVNITFWVGGDDYIYDGEEE